MEPIVWKAPSLVDLPNLNLVQYHIGNGVQVCACIIVARTHTIARAHVIPSERASAHSYRSAARCPLG